MSTAPVRVRFAPSPTGFMHLGNVRAALMNFLFARQKQGTFILRLEDTDPERNVDPGGKHILDDLAWLALAYDEGPGKGGPYAPYLQSERSSFYQEYLAVLQKKGVVYPCFCSVEELEKKRERQRALRLPPRYDRSCLRLTDSKREALLQQKAPFVWRFKLDDIVLEVYDMAHGKLSYNLNHFSDFALTRQDGSFTFIFANFVDDLTMQITQVIRGEDHLTNTALQAALYRAFDHACPIFWHLPIIVNSQGKKLSKRDFGFSLTDLRQGGFLPEAVCNYLAIIGKSFSQEIMSLEELITIFDFTSVTSTGHIQYDTDKLRWVNHQWIQRLAPLALLDRIRPYLRHAYAEADSIPEEKLNTLVALVQPELTLLHDIVPALAFYFRKPHLTPTELNHCSSGAYEVIKEAITRQQHPFSPEEFLAQAQYISKERKLPTQELFATLRLALTGSLKGPRIKDLMSALSNHEVLERLETFLINCRKLA
jgi:nondiscriminating glutamyl-tRNA synthetase